MVFAGCCVAEMSAGEIRFEDVTETAGLAGPLQGLMGHGGAWGDVDNDGDLDLYVGGFADRPDDEYRPADGPVGSRLLINEGGTFRLTDDPEILFARTSGAVFADLDNDGDLELYVANNAKPGGKPSDRGTRQRLAKPQRSLLYRNDGGKFVDVSRESGACPEQLHTARNVGVFDYDNDGLLDLLLIEDKFRKTPSSRLLRNQGDLTFRDVTEDVGLPDDIFGLGHAVADLNDDGRPDFFIGHSNRIFLSKGKTGYYEPESLKELFAWEPLHNEDWPCGASFGDLNNDGRLDMVLSIHCETARNRVYLHRGLKDGIPRFEDVTKQAGWPDALPEKAPHVEIHDFDNDGRPDVYFSAGWISKEGAYKPLILRNIKTAKNGVPQFEIPGNLSQPMVYYPAGPAADFDRDGRIDLFQINWFAGNRSRLLRNVSANNHWLEVTVTGVSFNRMGIGTRVQVFSTGKVPELLGTQEIQIGTGYASGGPAVAHFGLGDVDTVSLKIRLPNGEHVEKKAVAVNQRIEIKK